jgi:hypothetical protein
VNKTTSYEILITQKVAQLPIPDMSDSIWATIEIQLDAGSLPNEGDKQPTHNPTKGLPGKGIIISTVTVVIVASILIFKNQINKTNQPKKSIDKPATTIIEKLNPIKDSNMQTIKPIEKNTNRAESIATKKDIAPNTVLNKRPVILDATLKQVIPDIKIDSLKNTIVLPPIDSSAILKPNIKKPKGVKGITDEDYRIKAEKKEP